MAAIDAKRYGFIMRALEFKVQHRTDALLTKFGGWDYEGEKGIFWTARRNFPQVYNREHPQQTSEGNLAFAETIVRTHNLKSDPVLEKFFDELEAPFLDPETAGIIDQAQRKTAPPTGTVSPPQSAASQPKISFSRATSAIGPAVEYAEKELGTTGPPIKKISTRIGLGLGDIGSGLLNGLGGIARGSGGLLTGSTPGGGILNAHPSVPNFRSARGLGRKIASKKKWFIIFGLLLFLILGTGFIGGPGIPGIPGGNVGTNPAGGGNLASCTFTRANNPQPIKSTILQGWIASAANSAGIPPAVLASVAMHESQSFMANADDNHDAIKTNNYCNPGIIFCEDGHGNVLHSKRGVNDPCSASEIASGNRNAQAKGIMQLLDIYNPGNLCSITDSLAIAANKLKGDGITQTPTQDQINKAIQKYYNSCSYGSFSYCNEVWNDTQKCSATPFIPPNPSLASILSWDEKIVNALTIGIGNLFSKLTADITNGTYHTTASDNIYWCTYSIIDSYNLAGFSGLSKNSHAAVYFMEKFWMESNSSYKYLDYLTNKAVLSAAQPGYAIFMYWQPRTHTQYEHVAMVTGVDIDSKTGSGYINTRDSNSTGIKHTYTVTNWVISGLPNVVEGGVPHPYQVTGFGGI